MMKKAYIAPEMDVVTFAAEEEITVSGGLTDLIESLLPGNNDTP